MVLIGGWDFLFFTPLLLYRLLFASQQISLEFNHPFFIEFTNAISAQINVNCIETMCDFLPRTSESKQQIFLRSQLSLRCSGRIEYNHKTDSFTSRTYWGMVNCVYTKHNSWLKSWIQKTNCIICPLALHIIRTHILLLAFEQAI